MATGLLRLCALSSMVRGSLLLLDWILEQPQSSAWQELSLGDTHELASTHAHTHVHTHTHTPYKPVIKHLPQGKKEKRSYGFLATIHMKNGK